MNTLANIVRFFIDALLPKKCVGCQELGSFMCGRCSSKLPRAHPPKQSYISALFDYRNPTTKQSIWQFKYKNLRGLADFFGERLYEEILGDLSEELLFSKKEQLLLVPIPLHPRRLRERGYNQSELLVKSILNNDANQLFKFSPDVLVRVRETKPQAKKEARSARIQNLRGAFNSNRVLGKKIILVDDVTTTGATIEEARNVLLAAGARSVRAYTVAH
jgi:ComF family protein